ncbi:MAG: Flp pilus assembly complex ATPase component TadA, partial [Gemmatimonadetes bacterium]|nr:Flp pilus assembly complex ATPase component TadA [Gemmatimonadota bacterium]
MARLDQFIDVLHRRNADALQALPGQPITLLSGGQGKPLTARPVEGPQIRALVGEIAEPSQAGRIAEGMAAGFAYQAPSGRVQVDLHEDGGEPSLTIRPVADHEAGNAASERGHGATPAQAAAGETDSRLDGLLRTLVESGASDLHLRVGQPPILRKDGTLVRLEEPPLAAEALAAMHRSIMSDSDRERFQETGDADYAYEIEGVARFRANAAVDRNGPIGVFRVIPSEIPTCEQMGIAPELQKLCFLHKGLVVVTGPTGTRKSTTLAAMVDLMNREREDHILTIEDPIEFVHESRGCLVTHRQVGLHTRSFKAGLRAALR